MQIYFLLPFLFIFIRGAINSDQHCTLYVYVQCTDERMSYRERNEGK